MEKFLIAILEARDLQSCEVHSKDKNGKGNEVLEIYHSSPKNQANADYHFYSKYEKDKFSFRGTDVFDANDKTLIRKSYFLAEKNEIIEINLDEVTVNSKDIEHLRTQTSIDNLFYNIQRKDIKILSRKITN